LGYTNTKACCKETPTTKWNEKALGALHTRAKSRDHEIVTTQMKVSKGQPKTPAKSCSVVTNPQV